MEELKRRLDDHIADHHRQTGELMSDIRLIKENHLAHIEKAQASMLMDISWIKWIVTVTCGATFVSVIGLIFELVKSKF